MSLLFCDSADHYQLNNAVQKWHSVGNQAQLGQNPASTFTGAATFPGNGNAQVWRGPSASGNVRPTWNGTTNEATVIMGGWFYFEAITSGTSNWLFAGYDSSSTTSQWEVRRHASNHVGVYRNGTLVGSVSTNTFSINTWYHVEAKITTHNTAGAFEIRVNGSSTNWVPSATSQNTRGGTSNNYTNQYQFLDTSQNNSATQMRSVYVLNTSGSNANDFLGVCQVHCLRPVAAGNYAQWTANAGANFGMVDDWTEDLDSSFNQSGTTNNIDSFTFGDLPTTGTVFAYQHVLTVRQDGGAGRTIAPLQRSSGTDYVGTTLYVPGSYLMLLDPKTTDPATSAQPTAANLNAAEFGYKLLS